MYYNIREIKKEQELRLRMAISHRAETHLKKIGKKRRSPWMLTSQQKTLRCRKQETCES